MTPIPKPDEDTINKENYKPTSLMNTDTEICNKVLVHGILQYIKKNINTSRSSRIYSWDATVVQYSPSSMTIFNKRKDKN